jgi:hypothetical protein
MRFQHLKPGQRFVYQGQHYTKHTAMVATREDGGGQKLIPRWAEVTLLDADSGPDANRHELPALLDCYQQACLELMQRYVPDEQHVELQQALQAAAEACLAVATGSGAD